jgi:uncharacterized protein (TIGR02145 family)
MNKNYIPDSKLEWYLLNALPEQEQAEIAALEQTDEELRGRIEALRASDAEILEEFPPSRMAERFKQRYSGTHGSPRWSRKRTGTPRWPLSVFIGLALMLILPFMMIVGPELIGIMEDGSVQDESEAVIDTIETSDDAYGEDAATVDTIIGAPAKGEAVEDTVRAEVADSLKITYGTLIDSRDKKKYRTVKIGKFTWMAENLNYKVDKSWCYDDDESNCQKYGRLYDFYTALKVCPAGWRLPAHEDWMDLAQAVGDWETVGKKLKSKSGWDNNGNGTDEFGFSAMPGGFRDYDGRSFNRAGNSGIWQSASGDDRKIMSHNYSKLLWDCSDPSNGLSVRCIRK